MLVTSALPLRAARGPILSSCLPWKGCPEEEEGGSRLGLTGFSEAMVEYGSTSDKSGSASAWTGENGLDRAASKVFATSVAATRNDSFERTDSENQNPAASTDDETEASEETARRRGGDDRSALA